MLRYLRSLTGTPSDAVSAWTCPRCEARVELTGLGPRVPGRLTIYRPTVAYVVRACGCSAAGRPAVDEWPRRRRHPYATVSSPPPR